MPRRSRTNWPLTLGITAFLLLWAAYVAWPLLGDSPPELGPRAFDPHPLDQVRQRGIASVTSFWFFALGGTIGSFLNVVAYRMPMGLTIVSKPSRCSYCMQPILFRDNVPFLGWLALRGRCRACRLPISARYILVELLVASIFLSYFLAELASGGASLPIREPNHRSGIMWNVLTPQLDLIGIYAFHCFLLSVLATLALIKFDRLRVPVRLGLFSIVVGLAAHVAWPHLNLVPWNLVTPTFTFAAPWSRIVGPIIGLMLGAIVGGVVQSLITKLTRTEVVTSIRCGSLPIFALVGLFLGWQAIAPALLIGAAIQCVTMLCGQCWRFSSQRLWAMSWLLGVWSMLCFWRHLSVIWLPGAESNVISQVTGLVLGLALVIVVQNVSPTESTSQPLDTAGTGLL